MSRWLERCLSCLLPARVEHVDLDRQLAAHVVEQRPRDASPGRSGPSSVSAGWASRLGVRLEPVGQLARPHLLVGAALVEAVVLDPQQAGLLEVRRGQPPAALLVAVDAVGEHLAQHLVGLAAWPGPRSSGSDAYSSGSRCELVEHRWASWSCVRPWSPAASTARCSAERSSPTSTKSLKCPACSEASWRLSVKLSSLRASGSRSVVAAQLADRREAEDGRRRAAPAGAERAELAEVRALARAVRDAAVQAEAERRRDEVAGQPGRRRRARRSSA